MICKATKKETLKFREFSVFRNKDSRGARISLSNKSLPKEEFWTIKKKSMNSLKEYITKEALIL
jgi:hypothetical protein